MNTPAAPHPATVGGALIRNVYDGEILPPEPDILSLFVPVMDDDLTIRYRGKVSLAAPLPPMRNVTGWMN